MRKRFYLFLSIAILLIVISLFWGYHNYKKVNSLIQTNRELIETIRELSSQKEKKSERDYISHLVLRTIDGVEFDLKRNEKPILLVFLNTGCKTCIDSLFRTYYEVEDLVKQNVINLIGVGMENEEMLKIFRKRINLPIQYSQDLFARIHKAFQIKSSPSFVLIGKNGKIELKADVFSFEEEFTNLKKIILRAVNDKRGSIYN